MKTGSYKLAAEHTMNYDINSLIEDLDLYLFFSGTEIKKIKPESRIQYVQDVFIELSEQYPDFTYELNLSDIKGNFSLSYENNLFGHLYFIIHN